MSATCLTRHCHERSGSGSKPALVQITIWVSGTFPVALDKAVHKSSRCHTVSSSQWTRKRLWVPPRPHAEGASLEMILIRLLREGTSKMSLRTVKVRARCSLRAR